MSDEALNWCDPRAQDVDPKGAEYAFADDGRREDPPPEVGEVYLSDTRILHDLVGRDTPDRKPERPVLVVRAPTRTYPRVNVCVRQSLKEGRRNPRGVPHPADRNLKMDLAGVWLPRVKFAHAEDFDDDAVEWLGVLAKEYLDRVLDMVARGAP